MLEINGVLDNKNTKEFRYERQNEKTKVWYILQDGAEYYIVWGLLGCKLQIVKDVLSPVGKEGTKAYKTSEEQCALVVERLIRKKEEEGYRLFTSNVYSSKKIDKIVWGKPFPKNFCFYKPKKEIDSKSLQQLNSVDKLIVTRKRNGMMHIICKDDNNKGITIYTRRMDDATKNFPHLAKVFDEILPDKTCILGEIIYNSDGDDNINFNYVSRVCRSLPDESVRLQKEELGFVSYYIFDVAILRGSFLLDNTVYSERFAMIQDIIRINDKYVCGVENIGANYIKDNKIDFDELMIHVRHNKWEGLVLFQSDKIFDSKYASSFDGKAKRPEGVWKMKPIFEDDFIVRFDPENGIGKYGRGKNAGLFGAAQLFQIDKNGKEVFIGECGGGLDDEQRKRYSDKRLFPRVWCVEFSGRTPKGSLVFPQFNRDRTNDGDKRIEECLVR